MDQNIVIGTQTLTPFSLKLAPCWGKSWLSSGCATLLCCLFEFGHNPFHVCEPTRNLTASAGRSHTTLSTCGSTVSHINITLSEPCCQWLVLLAFWNMYLSDSFILYPLQCHGSSHNSLNWGLWSSLSKYFVITNMDNQNEVTMKYSCLKSIM